MSVTEIIVLDDAPSSSPQGRQNMIPRSFSDTQSSSSVTSNVSSRRKCRPRSRLSTQPVSSSKPRAPRTFNGHRITTISRKRKRERASIQPSRTESFHNNTTRQLLNGLGDTEHRGIISPLRRSSRLQNKTKRRRLNNDEVRPIIDLSNDHASNSSNSNHKMNIDDASDVELIEDQVEDVQMQDIYNTNTNNSTNNNGNNTNNMKNHNDFVVDILDEDDIDIDIHDIELPLFGIAIGKHQHFWNCKEDDIRPQIIINKHTNSIQMRVKSIHGGHFVSVSIKTSEIESLFLPQNPCFFTMNQLKVDQDLLWEVEDAGYDGIIPYLQVMFIQTKATLTTYQWLSAYYDPKDIKHPGIERITLIMGRDEYARLKALVMNKSSFCELRDVVCNVKDDEKHIWIDNLLHKRGTKRAWMRYDRDETNQHLQHLVLPDIGLKHSKEEDRDSVELKEAIDITETQTDDLSHIDLNIDDCSGDFSEYLPNEELLLNPHHSNSLIYAKTRTSEPSKTLECYWVFPAQHEHRQSIMHIESKDYLLVSTEDEYLNDTIIDFQLKYTYASWPHSFKENVYCFTAFFWKKLQKIRKRSSTEDDIKQLFRWSKRIKLFEKKYIIIPKCEHNHWELVIVSHAGKVVKEYLNDSEENDDNTMEKPCIAILDSLAGRAKSSEFALIRKWLNLEAKNYIQQNKNESNNNNNNDADDDDDKIFHTNTITGYIVKVPKQPNGHDCGCFLLRNVLQFGKERGFKDTSCKKNFNLGTWYDAEADGVGYRTEIASTLARLIREQKAVNDKLRKEHINRKKQLVREQIQKRKQKEKEKERENEKQNFKGYESS